MPSPHNPRATPATRGGRGSGPPRSGASTDSPRLNVPGNAERGGGTSPSRAENSTTASGNTTPSVVTPNVDAAPSEQPGPALGGTGTSGAPAFTRAGSISSGSCMGPAPSPQLGPRFLALTIVVAENAHKLPRNAKSTVGSFRVRRTS
mmetsp:Transcript_11457/g.23465  ORF Transcript_11457/g.23465 Transcript_11457/m.23465 type:complete len:148 (+) Transcript_11457:481-924(+)